MTIWDADPISLLQWLFSFVEDSTQTVESLLGFKKETMCVGTDDCLCLWKIRVFTFVKGFLFSSCSLGLDMLVEEALSLAAEIQHYSLHVDAAEVRLRLV